MCTSSGSGLLHPVGVAVGDHDVAVVQEPVEQADGGGVLGQETAPLVEGPVGADPEGAAFVGGGDEPEQQLGAGVVERGEPDFVDQEQVVAEQGLDDFPDAVVGQAAVEGVGQVGGGEVADLAAGAGLPAKAAAGDALILELPAVPVRPLSDYAIGGLS